MVKSEICQICKLAIREKGMSKDILRAPREIKQGCQASSLVGTQVCPQQYLFTLRSTGSLMIPGMPIFLASSNQETILGRIKRLSPFFYFQNLLKNQIARRHSPANQPWLTAAKTLRPSTPAKYLSEKERPESLLGCRG